MKQDRMNFLIATMVICLFAARDAMALKISKDTVRESIFPQGSSRATWHDSISLLNTTNDTIVIDSIKFFVPPGKDAEIEIGYNVPFRIDGPISGPVLRVGDAYRFFSITAGLILPRSKIPITGFYIESCINCPTGQGGGVGAVTARETLVMHLVFYTRGSQDTLIVLGDIGRDPVGIFQKPSKLPLDYGHGMETQRYRFFNILGRRQPWMKSNPVEGQATIAGKPCLTGKLGE